MVNQTRDKNMLEIHLNRHRLLEMRVIILSVVVDRSFRKEPCFYLTILIDWRLVENKGLFWL